MMILIFFADIFVLMNDLINFVSTVKSHSLISDCENDSLTSSLEITSLIPLSINLLNALYIVPSILILTDL